jgi:hypothetical protein
VSLLSYHDVCDLMAERGVTVVHTIVLRWVQCFVPALEKMWKKYARPFGSSMCYPMLGFNTFGNAQVTLSGIELANKIKKGRFDTSEITGPWAMILQVWEAALAA